MQKSFRNQQCCLHSQLFLEQSIQQIEALLNQVELHGSTTIDFLLTRFFSGSVYRTKGLQIIYHLLAIKRLTCNWFEPLSEFTEVWRYSND